MVGNSSTRLTRSFFYAWQPLFWEALCLLLEEEDRGLELNRVVLYILAYDILIHFIFWFSWCDSKLQFTERASQDRETAKHKKSFFPQIFQFKLIMIYEIISRLILCSNVQTISIASRRPEDGKGLFGKRVSAMASFLVLAKMASHRAKTSPLYHNEPPTSIEPLRGCSSSSRHIKRMSYTKAKQPRSSCATALHSSKAFWHLMITGPPPAFLLL